MARPAPIAKIRAEETLFRYRVGSERQQHFPGVEAQRVHSELLYRPSPSFLEHTGLGGRQVGGLGESSFSCSRSRSPARHSTVDTKHPLRTPPPSEFSDTPTRKAFDYAEAATALFMTAVASHPPPDYLLGGSSGKDNEGSSSSVSSTSSVSVPSRPPLFQRSASSPSMNHCWQLKTNLSTSSGTPLQPVIKEVKTSKDDTDISAEDVIVDPKTHHTFRKGRLIGKGGFAKVTFQPFFILGGKQ